MFKKGHKNIPSKGFSGKYHSRGAKKMISDSMKENHNSPKTEFKNGHTPWNKDKSLSKKIKQKISTSLTGLFTREKHWNWKGGISPIGVQIRRTLKYKQWRKAVFERDNYTCLVCGGVGGDLNAHHIKSFKDYPELRFEVNNGITLCVDCHLLNRNLNKEK